MEIAFIYNEFSLDGSIKAVNYNSIDPSHKSEIKFVKNEAKRIIEISDEQQDEIRTIINMFIAGHSSYNDNGNENTDHALLVYSEDGLRQVNYYYWKNDDVIPKGVEQLLKFIDKLEESFTYL